MNERVSMFRLNDFATRESAEDACAQRWDAAAEAGRGGGACWCAA